MNFPEEKIRNPEWYNSEGKEEDTSDDPTVIVRTQWNNTEGVDTWLWDPEITFQIGREGQPSQMPE